MIRELDVTESRSCPVADFGTSSVRASGSVFSGSSAVSGMHPNSRQTDPSKVLSSCPQSFPVRLLVR